jgi:hypothetical protein
MEFGAFCPQFVLEDLQAPDCLSLARFGFTPFVFSLCAAVFPLRRSRAPFSQRYVPISTSPPAV